MKTILILDDEQAVRQSLVDFFEDRCWRPVQAESAEQALGLLEQEKPVAAVVDVRLPGMDGNDFVRKVHEMDIAMACVICTGSPEYAVPPDLREIAIVSKRLFKKPIYLLDELEEELLRTMETLQREDRYQ